jgi:hypothetical protein
MHPSLVDCFFNLNCRLGGEPTGEPTRDDLMADKAGQRRPTIQAVTLSSPAAARHCNAWRWLVVAFSAKQKLQLHHQQLTNGSTILKTKSTWTYLTTYLQYLLDQF